MSMLPHSQHLSSLHALCRVLQMMSSRMEQDWSSIHAVLVEKYPDVLGGLCKEDYVWALSTVWSRAIGIDDEITGQQGAPEKRCVAFSKTWDNRRVGWQGRGSGPEGLQCA